MFQTFGDIYHQNQLKYHYWHVMTAKLEIAFHKYE